MKYDIEKMKRIDWAKFRSGEWSAGIGPLGAGETVELRDTVTHMAFVDSGGEWYLCGATATRMDEIRSQVTRLDAFIASEIAAMELADKRERTKPAPGDGFEYCEKDEATDYSCRLRNRDDTWSDWCVIEKCNNYDNLEYLFIRPIAEPLVLSGGEFVKWLIDNPGEHEFRNTHGQSLKWRFQIDSGLCQVLINHWQPSGVGHVEHTLVAKAKPTCERCGK